jgi:hypothetical protein
MDAFLKLAQTLHQTETWLNTYFPPNKNKTADKLRAYIATCRKTPSKWTDKAEAARTTEKIQRVSTTITVLEYFEESQS